MRRHGDRGDRVRSRGDRLGQRGDRGAVAAELALLLPVLLLILSGVVDLADALRARVQLQEAVQDGATYASHSPGDPAGTRARVVEASPDLTAGTVTVTCTGSAPAVVAVRATYHHDWLIGLLPIPEVTMNAEVHSDVMSTSTCVGSG